MTSMPPWPDLPEEHQWTVEVLERILETTSEGPDELRARARELRAQAQASEVKGVRDATLALAARYEEAAAARVTSA